MTIKETWPVDIERVKFIMRCSLDGANRDEIENLLTSYLHEREHNWQLSQFCKTLNYRVEKIYEVAGKFYDDMAGIGQQILDIGKDDIK